MILESALILGGVYGINKFIKLRDREENGVKETWNQIMQGAGIKNKIDQTYEILKIIPKEYGFDCIVSIPKGLPFEKLHDLLPVIKSNYGHEVKITQAETSAYMRLYKNIESDELKLKVKWEQCMKNANIHNSQNKTYEISKIIIQEKYGYDFIVPIISGIAPSKLEDALPIIEADFRCVIDFEWQRFMGHIYLKLATQNFDETKHFTPVETKPYELYLGDTFFVEHIVENMNELPHILIPGASGSGKSRCLFIALTNLLHNHDEKEIELYLAQVSDKKDLQKFQYMKQTKYFAKNINNTDRLISYMLNLQKERNRLLNKYGMNSIVDYNKKFPNNPMTYCYLVFDEFTSLMPGEKSIDSQYTIKKRCIANLHELMRQARSAGIVVISALQRPDKQNMDVNVKNLFNIKVAFRANNMASSKVLLDNDDAFKLPNREAIFIGSTQKTLKTPFINDAIITKLLKHRYEKDHKFIDINAKNNQNTEEDKSNNSNQKPPKQSKKLGQVD